MFSLPCNHVKIAVLTEFGLKTNVLVCISQTHIWCTLNPLALPPPPRKLSQTNQRVQRKDTGPKAYRLVSMSRFSGQVRVKGKEGDNFDSTDKNLKRRVFNILVTRSFEKNACIFQHRKISFFHKRIAKILRQDK